MNDEVVWLYQVIDHENMSNEELQKVLNGWSNNPAPHELVVCGNKMIVKFHSNFTRAAFFEQAAIEARKNRETMPFASSLGF